LALLLALLAVVAAGCGDDETPSAGTVPGQELTVPNEDSTRSEEPSEEPGATETAPAPAETSPRQGGGGGTPAPSDQTRPEDSPANDVPPPKDSPAARFEQFCDENPGAC
jgi:hypothetical protein